MTAGKVPGTEILTEILVAAIPGNLRPSVSGCPARSAPATIATRVFMTADAPDADEVTASPSNSGHLPSGRADLRDRARLAARQVSGRHLISVIRAPLTLRALTWYGEGRRQDWDTDARV
jgi:hypothetical protein